MVKFSLHVCLVWLLVVCTIGGYAQGVDNSTLVGKVMVGYQGWFSAEGDGSEAGWRHWATGRPNGTNLTFDLWPDLGEYASDDLFATDLHHKDGESARLFSSVRQPVVMVHFRWMQEYNIAGVFVQRFLCEINDPTMRRVRNTVTEYARAAAERHGRVLAIMYDISGAQGDVVRMIQEDWADLVDNLQLTKSPSYLHHNGKPVLGVWGLGFTDRPGTKNEALALIQHLKTTAPPSQQVYLVGGVPFYWRSCQNDSKRDFAEVYRQFDVISPWSVGRYSDNGSFDRLYSGVMRPDKQLTDSYRIGYAPVIWPGFSWANLTGTPGKLNQIPRRGGAFLQHQGDQCLRLQPQFVYVAMFDEVDEGTAIFKAAVSRDETPVDGNFLYLNIDGSNLPNDHYLRLTGGLTTQARQWCQPVLLAQATPSVPLPGADFNQYVLQTLPTYPDDGTHQYYWPNQGSWKGTTRDLYYRGELFAAGDPQQRCYCCGLTFEVFFRAYAQYCHDKGWPFVIKDFDIGKLNLFLRQWFGADGNIKTLQNAIVAHGLGRAIPVAEAQPGDFVQLWRHSGSGHSVIFIAWIKNTAGQITGVRYWSTQKGTQGIGYNTEYFGDTTGMDIQKFYVARIGS